MINRNMFKRLIENKDKPKVLKRIMKGIEEETKYNEKVEKAIENEIKNNKTKKVKKQNDSKKELYITKYEKVFTQDFMLKPDNKRLYYLDGVLLNGINNKQLSNELCIKIMEEYLKNGKLSKKYTKYIKDIEDGIINITENKDDFTPFIKKIEDEEIKEMGLIGDDILIWKIINNFNINDNTRDKIVYNLNNNMNIELCKKNTIKNYKMYDKYEECNMLKCNSELKFNSNYIYVVETKININDEININDKIKRALIKSIIEELNKNFDKYEFTYNKLNRISKKDKEPFFFDPKESGGLEILGEDLTPELMDFYKSLLPDVIEPIHIIKPLKVKKTYKEGNILKCNSELKINSNNNYEIETKLNIDKKLDEKIKRALIKSIIKELNKNFIDYEFKYTLINDSVKLPIDKKINNVYYSW